jgi:hypothetical protein
VTTVRVSSPRRRPMRRPAPAARRDQRVRRGSRAHSHGVLGSKRRRGDRRGFRRRETGARAAVAPATTGRSRDAAPSAAQAPRSCRRPREHRPSRGRRPDSSIAARRAAHVKATGPRRPVAGTGGDDRRRARGASGERRRPGEDPSDTGVPNPLQASGSARAIPRAANVADTEPAACVPAATTCTRSGPPWAPTSTATPTSASTASTASPRVMTTPNVRPRTHHHNGARWS